MKSENEFFYSFLLVITLDLLILLGTARYFSFHKKSPRKNRGLKTNNHGNSNYMRIHTNI